MVTTAEPTPCHLQGGVPVGTTLGLGYLLVVSQFGASKPRGLVPGTEQEPH